MLSHLVVRAQFVIAHRPVDTYTVLRIQFEIIGQHPKASAEPMERGATRCTSVIAAERKRSRLHEISFGRRLAVFEFLDVKNVWGGSGLQIRIRRVWYLGLGFIESVKITLISFEGVLTFKIDAVEPFTGFED